MLAYTAALKTSHTAPASDRAAAVEALLRDLDLTGCADVMIGDTLRKGVSGGQVRAAAGADCAHGLGLVTTQLGACTLLSTNDIKPAL